MIKDQEQTDPALDDAMAEAPPAVSDAPDMATDAEGATDEVGAGDEYDPSQTPTQPNQQSLIAAATKGQVSHYNDFDLTLSGIVDGDPVGLETFDLGYFKDGTPSISINGANVPIRMDQWMSLLTMREKTRAEVRQKVAFEKKRKDSVDAVSKLLKTVPLEPGLAELFSAQAQIDPARAIENMQRVYVALKTNGSRALKKDMTGQLQESRILPELQRIMTKRGKKQTTDANLNTVTVEVPSLVQENAERLLSSADDNDQFAGFAIQQVANMYLSPELKTAHSEEQFGFFDRLATDGGAPFSQMGMYERMRAITSVQNTIWPNGAMIPKMDPPTDPTKIPEFRQYLTRLDEWAANNFGYSVSTPAAINNAAVTLMARAAARSPQSAPAAQPAARAPAPAAAPAPAPAAYPPENDI
jgi:hypothetical protein